MGRHDVCSTAGCSAAKLHSKNPPLCLRCYMRNYNRTRDNKLWRYRQAAEEKVIETGLMVSGERTTPRFMALQALSAWRGTEMRVAILMEHMGLNAPVLQRDASSIVVMLQDLESPIEYIHVTNVDYLKYWGGVFFALDEMYMQAVGILLKNSEPWRCFTEFANRVTHLLYTLGADVLEKSAGLQQAAKYYHRAT